MRWECACLRCTAKSIASTATWRPTRRCPADPAEADTDMLPIQRSALRDPAVGCSPRCIAEGDLVIVYEGHQNMKAMYVDPKASYDNKFGHFPHKARLELPAASCCLHHLLGLHWHAVGPAPERPLIGSTLHRTGLGSPLVPRSLAGRARAGCTCWPPPQISGPSYFATAPRSCTSPTSPWSACTSTCARAALYWRAGRGRGHSPTPSSGQSPPEVMSTPSSSTQREQVRGGGGRCWKCDQALEE